MEASSVHVSVTGAASKHKQAEKKFRKRKELDAMVANITRKRLPDGAGGGAMNVSQQHELLRGSPNTDETSDDDFGVPGGGHDLHGGLHGVGVVQSHGYSVFCRTCRGLWVALSVGASFIIVITVLGLHVQMKMELDAFRNELEQVVNERNELKDKYHDLYLQIQDVSSNHSNVNANLTRIAKEVKLMSSQINSLNTTLHSISASLAANPELKDLPAEVDEVKNDVAKFGSRLMELESMVKATPEASASSVQMHRRSIPINSGPSSSSFGDNFYADDDGTTFLGQILNSTRILRLDLNALDARLTTVGKNLASQVQEESDKTEQNRADVNSLQQLVKVLNQGLKSAEKRCEELENGGALSEKSNSGVKRPIVQVGSTIANEKSKEVKNDLNAENK